MKALSVRAPWWWAILHLGKDVENRDWPTSFRGTVWLHAGVWWSGLQVHSAWNHDVVSMWRAANPGGTMPGHGAPQESELRAAGGCLVGKVDIVDCVTSSTSPWFCGKYGFMLANPMALVTPIPFRGALKFFDVQDGVEQKTGTEGPGTEGLSGGKWKSVAGARRSEPLFVGLDLGSRDEVVGS